MFGLTDELQGLEAKIKTLEENVSDLSILVKLLLDRPNDQTVRSAVMIALKRLE